MIPAKTSEKLKRGLGPNYFDVVKGKLSERGIVNRNGTPHNKQHISLILGGERHAPEVEEVIYEVYTENVKQIFIDAPELGVPIPEPGEPIS